jgi:hypothetical protein
MPNAVALDSSDPESSGLGKMPGELRQNYGTSVVAHHARTSQTPFEGMRAPATTVVETGYHLLVALPFHHPSLV